MLQAQKWRLTNLEFVDESFEVFFGLLEGFSKRPHRDEQVPSLERVNM